MRLPEYSMGIGDRFGHQGIHQLRAFLEMENKGISVCPVWNKSHREHKNTDTLPPSVREEAENAVQTLKWQKPYFVDADHITSSTLNDYLATSDFFTIDVAAQIGSPLTAHERDDFLKNYSELIGIHDIPGLDKVELSKDKLADLGDQYWIAAVEAGNIFQRIAESRGQGNFLVEISMDEVQEHQSPLELYFILKFLSDRGVMPQTIAPKFPGRFNKGIDYSGDISAFDHYFTQYLAVLRCAVQQFGLPSELKLSIHTGSDKFSLYPVMKQRIREFNTGIHLKTAGTTWLEEIIGLCEDGEDKFVKQVYSQALDRYEELTSAYLNVLDIRKDLLPSKSEMNDTTAEMLTKMLRHDSAEPLYNPGVRQLMHTAYKIAAEQSDQYTKLLRKHSEIIGRNVYHNILNRHLVPLFL